MGSAFLDFSFLALEPLEVSMGPGVYRKWGHMHVRQVLAVLFLLLLCEFPNSKTYAQVVATWTDSSGNWSNSANWSTLTVPNNGGGKTYNVVINGTGADTITFDASSTTINSLTLGPGETFKNNGVSQTLTAGIDNSGTF